VLLVDLEGNGRADGYMFGLLELVGHARPGTLRLALPIGPAATNVNHVAWARVITVEVLMRRAQIAAALMLCLGCGKAYGATEHP